MLAVGFVVSIDHDDGGPASDSMLSIRAFGFGFPNGKTMNQSRIEFGAAFIYGQLFIANRIANQRAIVIGYSNLLG
jgi:hypothetical protein